MIHMSYEYIKGVVTELIMCFIIFTKYLLSYEINEILINNNALIQI